MLDKDIESQKSIKLDESSLENFKYFLECYFNQSFDYSELKKLVNEFKNSEPNMYVKQLKKELQLISDSNDWNFIEEFVKKYGMRELDKGKLKSMIKTMNNIITDI